MIRFLSVFSSAAFDEEPFRETRIAFAISSSESAAACEDDRAGAEAAVAPDEEDDSAGAEAAAAPDEEDDDDDDEAYSLDRYRFVIGLMQSSPSSCA